MRAPGADPSSTLAATMLEVALAEVAEPERLRRGRRYARQGAVVDLVVAPGVVTGSVQGSRSQPYEVEVRALGPEPSTPCRLTDLVPKGSHIGFRCSCPDWEHPCKHGVAVLTHLAERVPYDPSLLTVWRGATGDATGDQGFEADAEADAAAAHGPVAPPSVRALAGELTEFLGSGRQVDVELPELTPLPHVTLSWDEPWAAMLHDALRIIARDR
jgi:hypothetical protein